MLRAAEGPVSRFPPTVLYNENWMLRLVLDWLVERRMSSLIQVTPNSTWYSEALLPSAFLPRWRGDTLGESYTHADGVVGQFEIGGSGKGDLVLSPEATQLSVIEGKMFSRLSKGVKNARYFDQAARNAACVAEVLRARPLKPQGMEALSFCVVAPEAQIAKGVFEDLVTKESIERKVRARVAEYEGEKDAWFEDWFLPTLAEMKLALVGWEALLAEVAADDATVGGQLADFYQSCVRFNSPPTRAVVDSS
jgi:hypothetical protein